MKKTLEDLYKDLGLKIDDNPSQDEIKNAYRVLAAEHHPDKGGDEEKFKAISYAYRILSSEDKRSNFSKYGSEHDDKMNHAIGNIIGIFNDYLNNKLQGISKPLSYYKEHINNKLEDMEYELKDKEDDLERLGGFKEKITTTDEDNYYLMALNDKAESIKNAIENTKKDIELTKTIIEMLNPYEEVDDMKQLVNGAIARSYCQEQRYNKGYLNGVI